MAHVKVSWTLQAHDFAFGTVADHFAVNLGGGVAEVDVPVDALEADFPSVDPGDYTASVQLMDATSTAIGDPATSGTFTVHPDMVSLNVAVGVMGTQGP